MATFTNLLPLTSRFAFRLMDDEHPCTPDMFNAVALAVDAATALPLASTAFTLGTGVTSAAAVQPKSPGIQRMRLTLTAARVVVTAALDYGSLSLMTWPNTNLFVVNARVNLVGTKDGTGIIAAATPTVAAGSVAASNVTLASTMIDTVDSTVMAGTLAAAVQKNGPATKALRPITAGASNQIFLNASIAIAADGFIDFTGTVDVDFIDLGLFS